MKQIGNKSLEGGFSEIPVHIIDGTKLEFGLYDGKNCPGIKKYEKENQESERVKKIYNDFVSKNQREPTEEELIKLSNITQKQYDSVILNKSYCQSLDTPITEDGKSSIEDIIPEEVNPLSDLFTKESILNSLKVLNPREYKVITEYYGLNGNYEKTIKEIAK